MATRLPDPNIMTLREAATRLGMSVEWAYRLARTGDFPGLIPLRTEGGKWLVSVPRFEQEVHGKPLPRNTPAEISRLEAELDELYRRRAGLDVDISRRERELRDLKWQRSVPVPVDRAEDRP